MNDEAAMLDEELDVLEETSVDDEPEHEDEFEYDENGNIVIPDVRPDEGEDDYLVKEFGEEDDDESDDESDEGEESSGGEEDEENTDTDSDTDAEDTNIDVQEMEDKKSDPKDVRIAQLEARLKKIEAQGKETLSKMGIESEDVLEGLMSIAAEADGISAEEYAQKKATEEQERVERERERAQAFEKMAREDLAQLHAAYPETKQYDDLRKLPRDILTKFARNRELGLTAKEAYAAANPDGIRTTVATAVKKKTMSDSKSHLRSTVPKGSKDDSISMTNSELKQWRDLFPHMSDKEIQSLYKKTAK